VGQLSLGDFQASVALALDKTDAGNVELVPNQNTEAKFQLEKNRGGWGYSNMSE
jgi:hypothetical protein